MCCSPRAASALLLSYRFAPCVLAAAKHDVQELERELSEIGREWSVREHPEWLAFEVEQQLKIRKVQFTTAKHLIENAGSVTRARARHVSSSPHAAPPRVATLLAWNTDWVVAKPRAIRSVHSPPRPMCERPAVHQKASGEVAGQPPHRALHILHWQEEAGLRRRC